MRQEHIQDLGIMFENEAHRSDMRKFSVGLDRKLAIHKLTSYKVYGIEDTTGTAYGLYFKDPRGRVAITILLESEKIFVHRYDFEQFMLGKNKDRHAFKITHPSATPVTIAFKEEPFEIVDVRKDKRVKGAPTHHYMQIYPRYGVSDDRESMAQPKEMSELERLKAEVEQLASALVKADQVNNASRVEEPMTNSEQESLEFEDRIEKIREDFGDWQSVRIKDTEYANIVKTPAKLILPAIGGDNQFKKIYVGSEEKLELLEKGCAELRERLPQMKVIWASNEPFTKKPKAKVKRGEVIDF